LAFAKRAEYEVVGIWKEVGAGVKTNRAERKNVMALAQDRRIEAVIVTELTRWGRSTIDLIQTLQQLQAWGVSLRAQTGLDFDLGTPQGKMMASVMAALTRYLGGWNPAMDLEVEPVLDDEESAAAGSMILSDLDNE
jgi:DNA invertase Pin-like site-specific DNA recombinase